MIRNNMYYYKKGKKYDMKENYHKALYFYEKSIENSEFVVDGYLNTYFLYEYIIFDYGFGYYYDISSSNCNSIFEYDLDYIMNEALRVFPDNNEIKFWNRYWDLLFIDKPFSREECEELVSDDNLVPYFFLYKYDEEKYKIKVQQLFSEIKTELTIKNRYVIGILSSNIHKNPIRHIRNK